MNHQQSFQSLYYRVLLGSVNHLYHKKTWLLPLVIKG